MKVKTIKTNQARGKKKRAEFLVTWHEGTEIKAVSFFEQNHVVSMLITLESNKEASNLKIYRKIV